MAEKNSPKRAVNQLKAERDRWRSDSDVIGDADTADLDNQYGPDQGNGISNHAVGDAVEDRRTPSSERNVEAIRGTEDI